MSAEFSTDDSGGDGYVERFGCVPTLGVRRNEKTTVYVLGDGGADAITFVAHYYDAMLRERSIVKGGCIEECAIDRNLGRRR